MRIGDYHGGVAVVDAEATMKMNAPVLIVNCSAVYVCPRTMKPEDMALVKRGLVTTLDDPHGLEELERKYRVSRVDLPPRDVAGVDVNGVNAVVGECDGEVKSDTAVHLVDDVSDVGGGDVVDGQRRGAAEVKGDVESVGVAGHGLSFLRRVWRVLHGVSHPNAAGKGAYVAEVRR